MMKAGKREYMTFVSGLEDLLEGQEIDIFVRDLTPGRRKFNGKRVKAVVSSSPEQLPEGDILWIRSLIGVLYPKPWYIHIKKSLDPWVSGFPHQGIVEHEK